MKISRKPFDLVVIDIQLGDGSGIDLYDRWTRWSKFQRPSFLFLTGDVLNAKLMQGIEKRGLALLNKPVDLETFQRVLRTLLADGSVRV